MIIIKEVKILIYCIIMMVNKNVNNHLGGRGGITKRRSQRLLNLIQYPEYPDF
jgi:hypothetical protein